METHSTSRPIRCWCRHHDGALTATTNIAFHYEPKQCFNSIIDYSKYLLTQVIYMDYLFESVQYTDIVHPPVLSQLAQTLGIAIRELPTPDQAVGTRVISADLKELYSTYYIALTGNRYSSNLNTIDLILAPNLDQNSPNTCIGEGMINFLVPYLDRKNIGLDISRYCQWDDSTNTSVFINPKILIVSEIEYIGTDVVVIELDSVAPSPVYFTNNRINSVCGALGVLTSMDLTSYVADDIIVLINSMNIVGSNISRDESMERSRARTIVSTIFALYEQNRLKRDIHQPLLAQYISMSGLVPQDNIALEVLTLPKSKWTDKHVEVFNAGPLYRSLGPSLALAMEANTENTEGTSMGGDDPMEDTGVYTEDDTDGVVDDNVMQLLELADPTEKFSEYVYRKLLTERMIAVIKNPPPQMSKAQIKILKSWLTHWINLVSIKSIKSFLTKFQFDTIGIKTYRVVNATKK